MKLVITATNSVTAVGNSSEMTASSVRAGISRLSKRENTLDSEGNPISTAPICNSTDTQEEASLETNTIESTDSDDYKEYEGEDVEVSLITQIAKYCLSTLLDQYFSNSASTNIDIYILLGTASKSRPGPRYEGNNEELCKVLKNIALKNASHVKCGIIPTGNASTLACIQKAQQILTTNTNALCIIGGIDSLLGDRTLQWYEDNERLKSETFGRQHGFSPGEAVAFTIVESERGAYRRNKKPMVEISGIGIADEPAPFLSEEPSTGEGLTTACQEALYEKENLQKEITTVLSDLNGEYFSMKEWSYTEIRCFNKNDIKFMHPADCLGSVGAASGTVLINIAAIGLLHGWIKNTCLIFCSDDGPQRGALVLKRWN
jgi:3-oxoacyl-[acyl-carrier-protein] synthase-1